MAVTGTACTENEVRRLVAQDAVVVVWASDAARCGRLVGMALDAGGRAASFVAGSGPAAEAALRKFAAEQFGGLDSVIDSGRRDDP